MKKGFIWAITDIPFSASIEPSIIDFTPKTISKIKVVVVVIAGASLTVYINSQHDFPVAGAESYELYSNIFDENGTVQIDGSNFHKYSISMYTDASTTGRVYIFFEYDYDLIK